MNINTLLLLIILFCHSYAQNEWCGSVPPDGDYLAENEIETLDGNREIIVVRIFIHILRHTDGSYGISFEQANNVYDYLNEEYLPLNIQFELIGIDEILNTGWYLYIRDPQLYYENSSLDRIDIYIAPGPTEEAPTLSWAQGHYGQNGQPNPGLAISGDSFNSIPCSGQPGNEPVYNQELFDSGVLIHEMGHCLGLLHTFQTNNDIDHDCEELIDGSNCLTCGDYVCDTPAAPGIDCSYADNITCEYTGDLQEPGTGLFYDPDMDNYMVYTFTYCFTHYTQGQRDRMHTFLLTHPNLIPVISEIYELTAFHAGWNWVGFPVLMDNEDGIVNNNPDPITDVFNEIESDISSIYIEEPLQSGDNPSAVWELGDWDLSGDLHEVNSLAGYFVEMPDDQPYYNFPIFGERIAEDYPIELETDDNWIPYFIPESQHPSDAFPQEVLDNMTALYSEHWFMIVRDGELIIKSPCPDTVEGFDCYHLRYGAMYKVVMSSAMTFTWTDPMDNGSSTTPNLPQMSSNFPYEPDKEYIPLVIEDIENGEDVVEIGVVQNNEYVGAELVDGYPINLRVYAGNLNDISFEVITSGEPLGKQADEKNIQQVLDIQNKRIENGITFAELVDVNKLINEFPETFSLVQAYPNPFNPSIDIRFNLNGDSFVGLSIFNLKGQQIATLLTGQLQPGQYSTTWNGIDDAGNSVSSGVYIYRLQGGEDIIQNKIMFLKYALPTSPSLVY